MTPARHQRQRVSRLTACLLIGTAAVAWANTNDTSRAADSAPAVPATTAAARLPTVDTLMGELLARLPSQTIMVSGDLITTATNGAKTRLMADIVLSYPRTAIYTIRDAFGKELEELTVTRSGKTVSLAYKSGGSAAPPPGMGQRIQDTALSWMDLTLGFLWWDGGQIIGQMETRGQPCYVLDRHAPAGAAAPYASVRMWVDKRVSMLLQAEGYNMLGDCIRRLSVKSFKKINSEWMVKDLEFEECPEGPVTTLRVRNAEPLKPAAAPSTEPDAGLP